MSTKHTPGPWDYFVGNANGRGLIRVETACQAPVAGVHITSLARGVQSEADARLIAASPELFDVAKHVRDAIDEGEDIDLDRVLAAIAKAEGP
jgi:hypothetical protein